MEKIIKYFLISVFVFLPFNAFAMEKIFYLPRYNAENGVASLNKNYKNIDILAPQMHVVENDFSITGKFGPKLKKAIVDHKLKVMPLVANANFSQKLIHNLLVSEDGQKKVIDSLINLAQKEKYVGWQYDFEHISYLDRELYTKFVEKTYKEFKNNNLILSVVVVARTDDNQNTDAYKNWGGAYDYKKISDSCDFVSLMSYDDPNSIGPVASLPYVNKTLEYIEGKIPPEKLSLGVPLYYWKWSADSNKKIGSGLYKNILALKASYRHNTGFDESLGVSWLSYFFNSKKYVIWFEDAKSFAKKMEVIKNNELRGLSAWLIGGEDQGIWKLLAKEN